MINILVTGGSGIVGYGILRSLMERREEYMLVGSSIYADSITPAFCERFEIAPVTTADEYMPWILGIIKKYKIDCIIPGIEIDLHFLNENRELLGGAGAIPIINNSELVRKCEDKWEFYNFLKQDFGQYLIPTYLASNVDYCFPSILKPRRGYGSKGLIKLFSDIDLKQTDEISKSDYIYQPMVGNDDSEYTVSGFFDFESNLVDSFTLKRKLALGGYTESAVVCENTFDSIISKMGRFANAVGPTNFQFRIDSSGNPRLLEINPRISSSTFIRTMFGYNESIMAVDLYKKSVVPAPISRKFENNLRVVRYISEHIFYDGNN